MSYDQLFNLILIGESGIGKTSLRERFGFELDEDEIDNSIEVIQYGKDVELNEVGICRIHIWEFGAKNLSRTTLLSSLKKVNGVLIVFDITKIHTINYLDEILDDLRAIDKDIPLMLVGNKSDLSEKRALGRMDSFEFAHDRFCKAYIEISAKTGKKVEIMFHMITQIMWDYYKHKNRKKT